MTIEQKIVNELVAMTENNELRWIPTQNSWSSDYKNCSFNVLGSGGLICNYRLMGTMRESLVSNSLTSDLLAILKKQYPYDATNDEGLRIVLDCLQDEGNH